tara:strand:- start:1280 stop:3136 length:1857 start_codon:yes stop_codon:yes gene_type:complete
MAYQGLFTQGPSVDDLLEQRNKRATDLQQQLMTNAARGARDPAKAQAVSFLGSALGRALGGAVGEDEQMAKRKANIEEQKRVQGEFGTAMQGTPEQRLAFGNSLLSTRFAKEGAEILLQARKDIEARDSKKAKKEADEAKTKDDQLKLNNKGKLLASQLPKNHPLIEELQGDFVTQAMLTSARSATGGYFDDDTAAGEEKALQDVRNTKGASLAAQLGKDHPLYQGLLNNPNDALISKANNVSVDVYDRKVEQTGNIAEAASEQLLRTTTASTLSNVLPADHPLQEQLKSENVTADVIKDARKATIDTYSLQVAEGKVTVSEQGIKARLEQDSTSLALTLGKEKYPQLYAQLTTSPTAKIYAEAVKALDEKESTEKDTDIVAKYWGEINGKTVRIGDTRNGTQVQLTGTGHIPITGEVSQPSQKTEVTETPLQIARASYEYVQKSPDTAKLAKIFTLSDRVSDLVKFTDAGNPSAVQLLYRTVSELYNGDTRAASEILALKEAGTIPQKLFDGIASRITGQLTQETRDQLVAVANAGARAHNRTMGRIVSQEYKSRIGNFSDPSVLQQQMLVFFNSSDIMDVDGPLDPTVYPEGKEFMGTGENEGKEYMVIAGNIVEL